LPSHANIQAIIQAIGSAGFHELTDKRGRFEPAVISRIKVRFVSPLISEDLSFFPSPINIAPLVPQSRELQRPASNPTAQYLIATYACFQSTRGGTFANSCG
jgi:hypothetical protein